MHNLVSFLIPEVKFLSFELYILFRISVLMHYLSVIILAYKGESMNWFGAPKLYKTNLNIY